MYTTSFRRDIRSLAKSTLHHLPASPADAQTAYMEALDVCVGAMTNDSCFSWDSGFLQL
jgi:hypothetical protein